MVKRRVGLAIATAFILSMFVIFGLPYIFSAIASVPVWYLFPNLFSLSGLSPELAMSVKVNPMAPTMNNQPVTVTALDANNNTLLADALVTIDEGSYGIHNMATGPDGTAHFPYIGLTTQIFVSKDGYADSQPIVIPQIPADWVSTRNYQTITVFVTIICSWGAAGMTVYFGRKPETKLRISKKRKS